jgi:hypothetical protein
MKNLLITMYLLSICLLADAQQVYTYVLTDGWKATKAFEIEGDNCLIVGLVADPHPSFNHRYLFTKIDPKNQVLSVDTFISINNEFIAYTNPFGVILQNDSVIISGYVSHEDHPYVAISSVFDTTQKLLSSYSFGQIKNSDRSYLVGSAYSKFTNYYFGCNARDKDSLNEAFFTSQSSDTTKNTIHTFDGNRLLSEYGPILTTPVQMLEANDGFLLVSKLSPQNHPHTEVEQGLVIKVDTLGVEQWRLPIWEDSTTVYNLIVAPMSNGNYLAVYQDRWYQPIKNPEGHPYAQGNQSSVTQFVEFNGKGEIVRKWNLRKELEDIYGKVRFINAYSHFLVEEDSSILLVGSARDNGKYGFDVGFLLKLDKYGKYKWYRQYELSISTPYNGGQENLFTDGITKLASGGYALAGEYRSQPSDSFPTGTQRGIVLFVDSFGCMEPGCQKNDNIGVAELQAAQSLFSVYPNPSSGSIQITNANNQLPKKVEVYDMQGRAVAYTLSNPLTNNQITLNSPSGIYYLKIYRSDGFHETHKIIKQ